ncbi:flagellar biosynthesis protein FlhG [Clostridium cavendishii DSM 21758]|uniref:Flagellar biosynthesis protein FlhG n=1 Tax=Clostridium cavendishii DSM 21758 TaxID=1121302 RepID=A0A1M6ASZ5_9CLOT|nr:MinD/ParA family protein [Clostridium cavendishii]SHI39639.1 flagellar biosynthesis protein FlhG [Clostridium cavendishii DSM 21758]
MLDQAQNLRNLAKESNRSNKNEIKYGELSNKPKIITTTSGKGGVGKSNFVVNLGITLQKMGKKVMIFDADIGMGNDDVLMGVYPKYNIFDIIFNNKEINEVVIEGPEGIKLLPGGSGLNRIEELSEQQRNLFLTKLQDIGELDYILMDTGAGISRSVLAFIACCEELIVITTPEPTSLTDAYSLLKATSHFKIKNEAKIVVNKAFNEIEAKDTFQKFNSAVTKFLNIKLKFLGYILEDRKLIQSVREQKPFVVAYPNSDATKCVENIAKELIGAKQMDSGIGVQGFFKKIFNIFS